MAAENLSNIGHRCLIDLSRDQVNLLNCLPWPRRMGALNITQVIGSFDNAPELIEIDPKKNNYFYQLYTDGIVSLDLDFKMQFGNRLLAWNLNFWAQLNECFLKSPSYFRGELPFIAKTKIKQILPKLFTRTHQASKPLIGNFV